MDHGAILQQAWRIAWKHKWLWLLSLLATVGVGGNTAGSGLPTGINLNAHAPVNEITLDRLIVILGIGGVLLIMGIILWIISAVARGALIVGVDSLAREGVGTLSRSWAAGVEHFGRLFIIGLITALPGLLLALLTFIAAAPATVSPLAGGAFSATVIACLLPLCCLLTLLGLVLGLLQQFADRAAVIENLPPGAALARGWEVLKTHLSDVFALFLIWGGVGWFFQLALLAAVAVVTPVVFDIASGGVADLGALFVILIGVGASTVVVLLFSVFNTFTSAMWTLAYRRLIASG